MARRISLRGFRPIRPGRIHLLCPNCKRKMSNMWKDPHDPPHAVLCAVWCEKCSQGCKVEGPDYYATKHGHIISESVAFRHYMKVDRRTTRHRSDQ